MLKRFSFAILLLGSLAFLNSCGGNTVEPEDSLADKVVNTWVAQKVVEGSTTVYDTSVSTQVKPAYSNYSLNLTSGSSATIKEVDGQTYTGTYAVSGTSSLTISGLSPQPTGVSDLTYSVAFNSDNSVMTLTALFDYPKTGETKNIYTLIPQ